MRKPTFYICKNKGTDPLHSNSEADQRLCFHYLDSTIPLLSKSLNPKFQAASHLLCLYSLVCVRPVRKPYCWFSHETTHPSPIKVSFGLNYTGLNLAKNFREKFLVSQRKFGRSLDLIFWFSYIIYTFSLLPQPEIGRSLFS